MRYNTLTMEKSAVQTSLARDWFTITSLVSRDFKIKYRRSLLGVLWSVLNPLLMMVVLTLVFSNFLRFNIEHYPIYLILGNTLFAFMAESTQSAMGSIGENASLIKKIRIHKLIFPFEKVLFQLVNFAISLIAVAMVFIYFRIVPTFNILFLPLLLVYVTVFSAGLGMALSALSVFFQDVCHLWTVVITAWTYATPLFYSIDLLPAWMRTAELYNPMYHYVTYFRDIALYGNTPTLTTNLVCAGFALVTFAVGLLIFKKTEHKFVLYV